MNPVTPLTCGIYVGAALCTLGMLVHFLKKMSDLEAAGTVLTPFTHLKTAPYRAVLTVLSCYLLLVVWYYMGLLNPLTAILTGVGCSEAYETLRTRAVKKLNELAEGPESGP